LEELGLQQNVVLSWFAAQQGQQYTLVSVSPAVVATWAVVLRDAFRRAYISDQLLDQRAEVTQSPRAAILAAKLPNTGSVMSGDFGEIVGYLYLGAQPQGGVPIGPKRWRLKQDRTKSAPFTDVVQFILPQWPVASDADRVVCAEVKAKATASTFRPIGDAIAGSQLDSTSRLSRTFVWLRERSLLGDDIGAITLPQLQRFIDATDFPPYARQFHAIAVICTSLIANELTFVPTTIPQNCALVILSIPNLRETYTAVYQAVQDSVAANSPLVGATP
jgi:hypothetical protein